jgi:2'-5' RNA ligase
MRLFVALDIDQAIRERIADFMNDLRPLAPAARWVTPDSLHVTLKFIGEVPEAKVPGIKQRLARVTADSFEVGFRGCGFFPTARSARVFWVGIEATRVLESLAAGVDDSLTVLGIKKEDRAYSPHLTLARAGGGSGAPGRLRVDRENSIFERVQQKLQDMPSPVFGTKAVTEFFLYQSQLSPKGARYTKLERFALRNG